MTVRATGGWPHWSGIGALAALAVGAQLWGLYRVTGPSTPSWFPHADKVQHALGFALPVALVLLALGLRRLALGRRPSTRTLGAVVAVFAAHGVLSELVQHAFYTARTGDPFDVLADWTGVAVGALVAAALLSRAVRATSAQPGRTPAPSSAGVP